MISFVVPAHNEAAALGPTLAALHAGMRPIGRPYEILVVDDASTDRTADIARAGGALVVPVAHRQIAATRNAGARAARGDWLFFVDADTHVPADVISAALAATAAGWRAAGRGPVLRIPCPCTRTCSGWRWPARASPVRTHGDGPDRPGGSAAAANRGSLNAHRRSAPFPGKSNCKSKPSP